MEEWPGWAWKEWRKQICLEKGKDKVNKAGRTRGQGTTSKARQERRHPRAVLAVQAPPPRPPQDRDEEDDGEWWAANSWKRDDWGWDEWQWDEWQWDEWEDNSWKRDSWFDDETDEEPASWKDVVCRERKRSRSPSHSSDRSSSSMHSTNRSPSWKRERRSKSSSTYSRRSSRSFSPDWDCSSTYSSGSRGKNGPRSRSDTPTPSRVWQKKELERQEWHLASNFGKAEKLETLYEKPAVGTTPEKVAAKENKPDEEKKKNKEKHVEPSTGSNSGSAEMADAGDATTPAKVAETAGKVEAPDKVSPPEKVPSTPAKVEATPEKVEATPEKVEETPEKVEETPVKVEDTPAKVGKAPAKVEKAPAKVMVDFHNVLEVDGHIPQQNIDAVFSLLGKGVAVVVCSFAFPRREREVMATLATMPWFDALEKAFCIRERTGRWGKSSWALHLGCTALFDDGADICSEAAFWKLDTYPICTHKEKHHWCRKPHPTPLETFQTFKDAVDRYLEKY